MKEGLLQLLQLQEVDKELFSLEEAKEKYPSEIGERQREIEKAKAHLVDLETTLEELEKKQRHCEREIGTGKVDLKEHEERFAVVTTNKEYDALQIEIEACKSSLAENESQLLEAMEGLERVQGQIEEEKQTFEEVRQAQQERIDELQGQLNTMQEQVDGVQKRRQSVAKDIDAKLLTTYERKKGRRGVRVAAVRKGACGCCFHQMPAQVRMEVRSGERGVLYCESCGTIMAWDEQSD